VPETLSGLLGWVALFFSSTFFTGFVPGWIHPRLKGKGGGLMGSLVGFGLLYLLWGEEFCVTVVLLLFWVILAGPLGVWVVREGERFMLAKWGPRQRHTGEVVTNDYNQTNWDEVLGMFSAALMIWPFREQYYGFWPLLAILVVFRILDTWKPWPIDMVEDVWKKSNPAFSVNIDDIVAGFISGLAVAIPLLFFT